MNAEHLSLGPQEILNQLGRICEDCYNLYKDAEVHGYCRFVRIT